MKVPSFFDVLFFIIMLELSDIIPGLSGMLSTLLENCKCPFLQWLEICGPLLPQVIGAFVSAFLSFSMQSRVS